MATLLRHNHFGGRACVAGIVGTMAVIMTGINVLSASHRSRSALARGRARMRGSVRPARCGITEQPMLAAWCASR